MKDLEAVAVAPPPGPVLVVDDDPSIREILLDVLDSEGFAVRTAANGAEALRLLANPRPSLILLDMRMPVMDGWEFARKVRGRDFRIVVMSAASDAALWAKEIGADVVLAKPFEVADLLDAIERPGASTAHTGDRRPA